MVVNNGRSTVVLVTDGWPYLMRFNDELVDILGRSAVIVLNTTVGVDTFMVSDLFLFPSDTVG